MRTLTLLRSSSALWVAPLALGLMVFYYAVPIRDTLSYSDFAWAPTAVSAALEFSCAFAYAVAAGLAVWESGGLTRGAIWELAPARSRWGIAALALLPVVGLAWLMLLLPVVLALLEVGAFPTWASLGPLLMAMLLCAAHAVIGFAVGRRLPRVVAAPVLMVVVWLVVATAVATPNIFRRHGSGQFSLYLMFGENFTLTALVAQALPTVGLALGVALLWLSLRQLLVRIAAGLVVVGLAAGTSYAMTDDWGGRPPLHVDSAPLRCAGTAPRVCVPEVTVGDIAAVEAEVAEAVNDLVALGVAQPPELVTDSLPDGASNLPSTADTWRLALTYGERQGNLRYRVVDEAITFPCSGPEPRTSRLAMWWLAERAGVTEELAHFLDRDRYAEANHLDNLRAEAAEVLALPDAEQLRWYERTLVDACEVAR